VAGLGVLVAHYGFGERYRTAELGGHVARCADCAYTSIAYNSCRNRHCPKCQGAAAKQWLKGACATNIARVRELLAVATPHGEPTTAAVDHTKPICPCCGGRMIIIEVFGRGCRPRHQPTPPTDRIRIDTS
jgi:hypothetical protein